MAPLSNEDRISSAVAYVTEDIFGKSVDQAEEEEGEEKKKEAKPNDEANSKMAKEVEQAIPGEVQKTFNADSVKGTA